ncbi:hypothetical protein NP493_208g04000 [Ridgeia piscesae]|uniref:Uncharacterized protein n=1 Tax=Ridgeia piscesae TaxID=27915 RepID=A0AAD9UEF5_RIDPI|nr:hypothetical protein NP493_208g04000 [Ridgeia piscesae]
MYSSSKSITNWTVLAWALVTVVLLSSETTHAWLFDHVCTDTCFTAYRECMIESERIHAKLDVPQMMSELINPLMCATERDTCLSKCPWWN